MAAAPGVCCYLFVLVCEIEFLAVIVRIRHTFQLGKGLLGQRPHIPVHTRHGCGDLAYMRAVQKRFDRQEHSELDKQVEYAQEELRRDMDAAGRRKLLRLLDAQNALLVEATLMSFTAGFKLAAGIAGELGTPYSFDADEEQKAAAGTARLRRSIRP